MEKEKHRLSRLTQIVTQLQSNKLVTAKTLAEKYQVSVRTIYRDIRTLENSGIPIVVEEGRGYSLMQGYSLPPVMFTEGEANALVTAEHIINKNKDRSLVENYENAITKIKSVLKHSQKEKIDFLNNRIQYREQVENKNTSKYLMSVQMCITNFQLISVQYKSLENNVTNRIIEPFAIYNTQGNWLLIAFCRLRKDYRSFRIDLIQNIIVQNEKFEPHKITLEEYFLQCQKKTLHS